MKYALNDQLSNINEIFEAKNDKKAVKIFKEKMKFRTGQFSLHRLEKPIASSKGKWGRTPPKQRYLSECINCYRAEDEHHPISNDCPVIVNGKWTAWTITSFKKR